MSKAPERHGSFMIHFLRTSIMPDTDIQKIERTLSSWHEWHFGKVIFFAREKPSSETIEPCVIDLKTKKTAL